MLKTTTTPIPGVAVGDFSVKTFGGVGKSSYLCTHNKQKTGEEQAAEHPEPPTGAAGGEGEREEREPYRI